MISLSCRGHVVPALAPRAAEPESACRIWMLRLLVDHIYVAKLAQRPWVARLRMLLQEARYCSPNDRRAAPFLASSRIHAVSESVHEARTQTRARGRQPRYARRKTLRRLALTASCSGASGDSLGGDAALLLAVIGSSRGVALNAPLIRHI